MFDLAKKLKTVRKVLGIKQDELAQLANISRSYLANVEARKTESFPYEIIVFLQKRFGINPDYFIEPNCFQIFTDSEKAIQFLRAKNIYNIAEVYHILSQIQNIYSIFDDFSVSKNLSVYVTEILSKYSLISENELEKYRKAIEKENMAWGRLMDEMIAVLTNHIIEKDFDISQELHEELQKLISDWGIYVFVAAAMYEKYKFIPLESIYIDLDSIKQKKDYDEKQIPRVVVESEKIKLLNFYGHFVLDFAGKGYIEFEKERLFGFICAVQNVKNDEKKRVLDYEVFYTEVEKLANIKQKDIALSLSLDEFHSLKECFSKINENKKLWQWLQVCFVERFGFV
ncbi:MAG: helix-turn-helix transcriptional regulator [Nitrososphaeria archaeon]